MQDHVPKFPGTIEFRLIYLICSRYIAQDCWYLEKKKGYCLKVKCTVLFQYMTESHYRISCNKRPPAII